MPEGKKPSRPVAFELFINGGQIRDLAGLSAIPEDPVKYDPAELKACRCIDHPALAGIVSSDNWGFNTQAMLPPAVLREHLFPGQKKFTKVAGITANMPFFIPSDLPRESYFAGCL